MEEIYGNAIGWPAEKDEPQKMYFVGQLDGKSQTIDRISIEFPNVIDPPSRDE